MTAAAYHKTQAKKEMALTAINGWFCIRRVFENPENLGSMSLDNIYNEVIALPDVIAYIYDDTARPASQARFWVIRTHISVHLKYYIDNKEL